MKTLDQMQQELAHHRHRIEVLREMLSEDPYADRLHRAVSFEKQRAARLARQVRLAGGAA